MGYESLIIVVEKCDNNRNREDKKQGKRESKTDIKNAVFKLADIISRGDCCLVCPIGGCPKDDEIQCSEAIYAWAMKTE